MCNPAQMAQVKYRLPASGHFENLVLVTRSVTSLDPSSDLRGAITIPCMIVAVTAAHGVPYFG